MLQSECGEKETFGANFNYKIKEFKISQESNVLNENTFVATVLVNVCDDQEIETFLTEFKEISNMDYNKNKADTKSCKFVKLSGRRKCIHNVQKKENKETKDQRSEMNTNCEYQIEIGNIQCFVRLLLNSNY